MAPIARSHSEVTRDTIRFSLATGRPFFDGFDPDCPDAVEPAGLPAPCRQSADSIGEVHRLGRAARTMPSARRGVLESGFGRLSQGLQVGGEGRRPTAGYDRFEPFGAHYGPRAATAGVMVSPVRRDRRKGHPLFPRRTDPGHGGVGDLLVELDRV